MKLYNADLSPFAARCRIQIYAKGLDIELVAPPGGLSSDEYKAINVTGRIPTLEVDGQVLPESEVICEYLEDRFPTPALRPEDPLERARSRLLSRLADVDVVPPLQALFGQVNPAQRDAATVDEKYVDLCRALDHIEGFIGRDEYAVGSSLTLADCGLVPMAFFISRLMPLLGKADPFESRPGLSGWWARIQKQEAPARVIGELSEALKQAMGG